MRIIAFATKLVPALIAGRKTVTRRAWRTCPYKVGDWAQAWRRAPWNHGRRVGYVLIRKVEAEPLRWIKNLYGADELQKEGGLWRDADAYLADVRRMSPGLRLTDDVFRLEISFFRRLPRGVAR